MPVMDEMQVKHLSIQVAAKQCAGWEVQWICLHEAVATCILEAATAHQALREVCAGGALGLAAGSRLVDPPQPHAPAVQNLEGLAGVHAAKVPRPSDTQQPSCEGTGQRGVTRPQAITLQKPCNSHVRAQAGKE